MLKSWSSAGLVSYHGFQYLRPNHFPFGGKAISREARRIEPKITETLFNWNTTGAFSLATYAPAANGLKVQGLVGLNTGSLPLIYKDEAQPAFDRIFVRFEDQGYEYFRTLRDPLLTRVTSYQMMFQATRDRPLPSATPVRRVSIKPPEAIRSNVIELLEQWPEPSAVNDASIKSFCELALITGDVASEGECERAVALSVVAGSIYQRGSKTLREAPVDFSLDRNLSGELGAADVKMAIELGLQLGEGKIDSVPRELERAVAMTAARYLTQGARALNLVDDDDRLAAFRMYSADQTEDPDSYIRTPLVVVSRNGLNAVGGHNLSGKTTAIETDAKLPPGTVRLDQSRDVIVLNPADLDRGSPAVRAYAKQAAGGADRIKLQAELQKALAERTAPRDFRTALAFDRPNETARGLVVAARADANAPPQLGFRAVAATARLEQSLVLAKQLDLSVVVLKANDEFVVICVYCRPGQEIRALSQVALRESVIRAINQAPRGIERRIFFQNFAREEVDAFQTTMAFGQGPPRIPPDPGTAAGEESPWRRGPGGPGGSGTGNGGGNNNAGGPGNPKLLVFGPDVQRGHQVEVQVRDGASSRAANEIELKDAYRQLEQPADWSRATVEPIGSIPVLDGERAANLLHQAFEMRVPGQGETPSLKFRVKWKEMPSAAERQGTLAEARAQLPQLQGASYQQGIEHLIERLRSLKVNRNAVADVRFFFTRAVFDAVITDDLSSSRNNPGG
jgi:hypothetical protein